MKNRSLRYPLGLAAAVALLGASPALAGRGGFHGGGGGGGGGGFHGGGGGGGFHPGGGFNPGGGFHPGGGFNPGGGFHPGGGFNPGGGFHPAPGFHGPAGVSHVENFNRAGAFNNRSFEANRFNNVNANRFNNVNVNRFNNVNVNRFNSFNNLGWRGPYAGYHSNWVHGYWNGHYNPGWWGGYGGGWGGGFGPYWGWGLGGFGLGMVTGAAAFGLGSSLYNWGYMPYANPYYGYGNAAMVAQGPAIVGQPPMGMAPYNYSQPINTTAPAADQAATDAGMQAFQSARDAFKAGDDKQALSLTDQALKTLPNDVSLHEFRALTLFALGQYDQAAAPLYAVLSMGPGWDWTTMAGLYPGVDVYTNQLRALEDFVQQHPGSGSAHFVLAYHYLTQGHTDAAVGQLRRVSELQPGDKLSAQILQQLTQKDPGPNPTGGPPPSPPQDQPQPQAQPQPQPQPASANVPQGNLVGSWTASPAKDTNIALSVAQDGNFTWKVSGQGPPRQFAGTSTLGNGILTLAQSPGQGQGQGQGEGANPEQGQTPPPLVGHVSWQDPNRFTFQVAGGPNDPGLTFTRSN